MQSAERPGPLIEVVDGGRALHLEALFPPADYYDRTELVGKPANKGRRIVEPSIARDALS
jgi:hypothetical protein